MIFALENNEEVLPWSGVSTDIAVAVLTGEKIGVCSHVDDRCDLARTGLIELIRVGGSFVLVYGQRVIFVRMGVAIEDLGAGADAWLV